MSSAGQTEKVHHRVEMVPDGQILFTSLMLSNPFLLKEILSQGKVGKENSVLHGWNLL